MLMRVPSLLPCLCRVGACLPVGCDGEDVIKAVLPQTPLLLRQTASVCGTHHYPPNAGT